MELRPERGALPSTMPPDGPGLPPTEQLVADMKSALIGPIST
jgi:hypothetical protein